MQWPDLRALIDTGDAARVADATRGLSEKQRRPLATPAKKHASWLRREWSNPNSEVHDDVIRWQAIRNVAVVACAACLPTAAALAPELTPASLFCFDHAFDIRDECGLPVTASAALRAREVAWLPELARRLAERLPTGGNPERVGGARGVWRLAADLARATGTAPLTDGFVLAWAAGFWYRREGQVADMMRRDPWLPLLVPRLFEVDESGVPYPALAALAADGTLDREMLVSCCLTGLRRTGNPSDVRGYRALFEALQADRDGQARDADLISDHVALLSAAHRLAAETGQRELRRLDEAGQLEFGTLLEISEIVLRRREGGLVRAQLDWLDAAARRDPSRAGELLRAVAVAFGQQSGELQRRALTVAIRHASHAGDTVLAELAAAAEALRPDLRDRATKAFGTAGASGTAGAQAAGPTPAVAERLPVVSAPPVREMPPPIGSPAELAEELAALYADCSGVGAQGADPVTAERVLAALVAFAHRDRAALHEALRPVLTRRGITPGPRDWNRVARLVALRGRHIPKAPEGFGDLPTAGNSSTIEFTELGSITGAAVGEPRRAPGSGYPSARQVDGEWFWRTLMTVAGTSGPRRALLRRLHEIAVGLSYAPRPLLAATPTTVSGLLDPAELLARLERAAAEGWEPWPCDLEQALLRLPRDADGDLARRARMLRTSAGTRLARWLDSGGLPDPEVSTVHRLAVIRASKGAQPGPMTALLTTLDRPEQLVEGDHGQASKYFDTWLACWPAMLPAHRDVVAAHLAPQLARGAMPLHAIFARSEPAIRRMLPLLAEADGPAGTGMNLALCYGLTARELGDRAAAVDALLILAGRGQLDGAALGADLGALAAAGDLPLNRAVPALADAARAGAYAQVWDLVAAALPRLFPPATPKPPQKLADLIALGVEAAEIVRPRAAIPGLAETAGRGGSARFVTESRRLLKILDAASP